MRERLFALLGGVVSLLLVLMILTPLGQPRPPETSLPTSVDRGDAGLLALGRWLSGQGVSTASHRAPLTELPDGRGHLLVMSVPGKAELGAEEARALRAWVEGGNHLAVFGAFASAPHWRQLSAGNVETALQRLELELTNAPPLRPEESGADDSSLILTPARRHPLVAGVDRVHVPGPAAPPPSPNAAFGGHPSLALLEQDGAPALWWLARGRGTVIVSAYTGLFSHGALAEADNARFAANLVNGLLSAKGRVIFDDYRFGLEQGYDPEAFYGDPRLHVTLLFIAAFWVLYAVG
ncbi:DUF4350 domain-containing protein, partial [Ectothiorhodospiraceae bacterium WFHF3C12]|nr:DUF4350 domain-containing protein [Ectothiorhodospiraceae bacterium WFHF3C12]